MTKKEYTKLVSDEKFKANKFAKKLKADNLERERGTEETVKQLKGKPYTITMTSYDKNNVEVDKENITIKWRKSPEPAYFKKVGNEVTAFDLDSELEYAKYKGHENGLRENAKITDILSGLCALLFLVIICLAWIVTH
jgi:hypothetical protein